MKVFVYIAFFSSLFIFSCSPKKDDGRVLAEAYGKILYSGELDKIISPEASFEDSVFMVKEYINVWLSKQVLLHEAEQVLSIEQKDKTHQLEQYKNDLLIYEVLNQLSLNELDTDLPESELEEYYNENIDEFELTQNIIKINFFKIPNASEDFELLWSNFRSNDESINEKLISLSEKGGNYYTDKTSWVYFDDILKEIPINTYNQEHFLNNNKFIKVKDGEYSYFIKIIDFKIRSNTSPFSMEKENIKKILLMKRQQELIKAIETNLIDEAYSKNKVRVY